MKIKLELDFTKDEMKEFLLKNGYKIESHKFVTRGGSTSCKAEKILAFKGNEISLQDEYETIFKKEILSKIKYLLLKVVDV